MIDFRLTPLLLSLSFFLSLFPLDNGNLSTVYQLDERGQMTVMNHAYTLIHALVTPFSMADHVRAPLLTLHCLPETTW
jgi:hypothetical protein